MNIRLHAVFMLIAYCALPPLVRAEEMKPQESITLISRIPPVIREGDLYKGGVAVMNRADRNLDIDISGIMKGYEDKALNSRIETLAAGESRDIVWDISVPHGMPGLSYEFVAQERDGTAEASLTVKQKIVEAVPLRIVSASLAQVETFFDIDVEQPKGAIAGRGGVTVTIVPRLAESLSAVETFMAQYPYSGLEQEISRAVVLRDEGLWKDIVKELPYYLDETGLVKHLPTGQHGDIALSSYIIAVSDEAGWRMPDAVKKRMEEGLRAVIADQVPWLRQLTQLDLQLRKISALEALSRTGTVDINSLTAPLTLKSLPSSAVIDFIGILRRTTTLHDREALIREAEQVLRSRILYTNRRLDFSTEKSDFLPSLMVSADVNAARLLLLSLGAEDWKQEIPKILAGLLRRQKSGTWQTTTANAWGVMAVMKYSRKVESAVISGKTSVAFAGIERYVDWSGDPSGLRIRFGWPDRKEMLTIHHQGMGRPWVMIQVTAAVPLKETVSSGLSIQKILIPIEQHQPDRWTKGDVVKVRIKVEAQSDILWVVINDPLPGGSAVLDSGSGKRKFKEHSDENHLLQLSPMFEFSSPEDYRAYFELMPKGLWSGEYLIRLQSSGTFSMPGSRIEALYSPEMFGELPYRSVTISEGK